MIQPEHSDFTFTAPGIKLDLSMQVARYEWKNHPFIIILTWNYADDAHQPVMMLCPKYMNDTTRKEVGVAIIERNDAWKWSRSHNSDRFMVGYHGFGKPPSSDEWQALNAEYYCVTMGIDTDQANRLRGKIEDHVGDLILMPPAPPRDNVAHATFTQTSLQTGKTEEITVFGD